ncbi:T9SS type A sorting domain-containing protein [Lacinutrix sp.]|uniref:T9SS type A sorting domain-containing protein n=1 Tax=Lacinutrix sp. TaxID=1937692 RepID=UPI0025BE3845|nr:T9SS type A sorting domain-containing protein [Lacinutrix sp.]
MKLKLLILFLLAIQYSFAQDLSIGYNANDVVQHPMQPLAKPAYLQSVTDPSFPSTEIRRITEATAGDFIAPMYSTIQSWNADESLMIVYKKGGTHQLLNGQNYTFIRDLTDVSPDDVESIFWSFTDPDVLFYMDNFNDNLYSYNVQTQVKTIIVNIRTISGCPTSDGLSGGNDIQMMSWDNDVFSFRCGNNAAYYYRISTATLTQFNIANISFTAPMPFPSGNLFFHKEKVYDVNGNFVRDLNIDKTEHSCIGKLSNGDDAIFAIAFEQGPSGGCQGSLVAHNATTGNCFSVTPVSTPDGSADLYAYPKSGTHISSLAHKNTEGGWVAVSSLGFEKDGVRILDQELYIAKVNEFDADVYRVAHHRSDEDEINYWGEPHVTISPTGTRLLFGSDWSGTEDGISVDSYVAELNSFTLSTVSSTLVSNIKIYPNPVTDVLSVEANNQDTLNYSIYDITGKKLVKKSMTSQDNIDVSNLSNGVYFVQFTSKTAKQTLKFIKK